MKKIIAMLLSFILIMSMFAGCAKDEPKEGNSTPSDETTETEDVSEVEEKEEHYPVTIENNGITITYEKAPERIVAVEYPVVEVLVALGLGDKIVALAPSHYGIEEVLEEYREEIKNIPVFPENGVNEYGTPTLEAVLSMNPDFVYGSFYTFLPKNCGSVEDFQANNINIYATEGTYVDNATMENLYNDIRNIGAIFDVGDRAEELIEEIRERENNVKKAVEGLEAKNVFIFDIDNGNGTYYSTGGLTFEDSLVKSAGGKNMFDDIGEQYVDIAVEEIIDKNPDYVIVTNYYSETDGDDGPIKVDTMKNSPDFKDLTAVKEDNFLVVSGLAVWPSLQSADALEEIAEFLHPEAFK